VNWQAASNFDLKRGVRNLRMKKSFSFAWRNCVTGHFAFIGILLILIDFMPLAAGLSLSKGNFQSKFIKIAFPVWFVMLVLGVILLIMP